MNLSEVCVGELLQDEWSLSKPRFGIDGQLEVVGWSGRNSANSTKFYILKCDKCSKDSELFGEGYFRTTKAHLLNTGSVPCGCTKMRWSREQYTTLCSRKASELGHLFLGFAEDWLQIDTKVRILCNVHGEWNSTSIRGFISLGHNCPECSILKGAISISISNRKADSVMIDSFFASGGFHPETKFWRSERLTKQGHKSYWYMYCPECGVTADALSYHLQKGKQPCACSNAQRQTEAYINYVFSEDTKVAIKFGISRNSDLRAKQQDSKSEYKVLQYSVYSFVTVDSCKKAETDCKRALECGVLSKECMSDGYTETTHTHNLDKIIEIYERNGGVRVDQ